VVVLAAVVAAVVTPHIGDALVEELADLKREDDCKGLRQELLPTHAHVSFLWLHALERGLFNSAMLHVQSGSVSDRPDRGIIQCLMLIHESTLR
jgi:hypothetical protein